MYRDSFPKVLVCCPTASVKNYCFEDWIENVMKFKYPNFEVAIFDNTNDGGENASFLKRVFKEKFGYLENNVIPFHCENSLLKNMVVSDGVMHDMCLSHNDCRDYMIKGNFDYMLHLESDVFPNSLVIENLMAHKKMVTSGLYYTDEGVFRKPMIQESFDSGFGVVLSRNFKAGEDFMIMENGLLKVPASGLGCSLIHRSVFKEIKFTFDKNYDKFPDSFFAESCARVGIDIYLDTACLASHVNEIWIN
jgi:hypothetical protein